jgi:hypothetical protein
LSLITASLLPRKIECFVCYILTLCFTIILKSNIRELKRELQCFFFNSLMEP